MADADCHVGMAPGRRHYTVRDLVLVAWALAVLDVRLGGRDPRALFPLVWAELGRRAYTAEAAALPRQCLSQIHQARLPALRGSACSAPVFTEQGSGLHASPQHDARRRWNEPCACTSAASCLGASALACFVLPFLGP